MRPCRFLIALFLLPLFAWGQTVSIGDILCTDGSFVSREAFPSSGRTAQGIVFYVDDTDTHGWAISLDSQGASIQWCSENNYGYDIPDLANYADARVAMHDLNGLENTGVIRNSGNSSDFPAAWAVDYDNGWYLPSAGQLRYLYSYAPEINASLQVVGGTSLPYHDNNYWWSSTEHSSFHAFDMNAGGSIGDYVKDNHVNYPPNGVGVRQIRDFTIPNPVHSTYHIGDLITNDDGSQGILFYVTPDQTEGWMVALNDASTSVSWGNGDVPGLTNQTYSSPYGRLLDETDGFANTGTLRGYQNGLNTAANVVDYEHGWYLPTAGQLSKLFGALPFVEDPLQTHGSTLAQAEYWSSSEANGDEAFTLSCVPSANIRAGHFVRREKSSNYRVRAVRNLSFESPLPPTPNMPDNVIEAECNQPLQGNAWDIQLLHSSSQNNVASYAPVMAGDIDNNGITDIVTAKYTDNAYHSNDMYVFNGNDLSVQHTFRLPDTIYNYNGYALARYPLENGTIQGAIFVHSYDKKIRAYAIDGTLLNVSDLPSSCDGMLSFADFNGDGFAEVYTGNDIFDAATLKWLCSGPENGNRALSFRAVTVNKTITPPSGYPQDGHVSLADFDLDGECEVLVIRDNTDDHTLDNCYLYAYRPSSGQVLFHNTVRCYCTSYPLIGNIDWDPHPEIVFLEKQLYSPANLYCWRYTSQTGLTTIWQQEHNDSSGQTGITLFDFNQDNIMELVYRDNRNLRVLNGSGKSHITGHDTICPYNMYAQMMSAGTGIEYPIVADVNGDGFAEIVAAGLLNSTEEVGYGGLHVFGSPGNWSPARPVWNQYMYHVTNVNEDLTIPTFCFNKATVFTVFTGSDGTIRRPYNNFLQQAYYITPQGEPYNPGLPTEISIQGSDCSSFTFNGIEYTESGHYEQLIESPDGCDTLYLIEVELGQPITFHLWKTRCDHFTWNDSTYYETGNYQQTFEGSNGCDSIVTLHLTIADTITREIERTRCKQYNWNGTIYTESGDYTQSFVTTQGCDSIVTLHLTITGPIYHEWSIVACDRYKWNDTTYTEPGDYVQEFVTSQECDSIVTLHLTFSDALEVDVDTTACDSYSWNGNLYIQSGVYDSLFITSGGCDSLVHLHLTVNPYPDPIPEIQGLTEVYVCTDFFSGHYQYHVNPVDHATHYEWELDGADWPMDTTGLDCHLWVVSKGVATLRVKAWNECGMTEQTIEIHAGFYNLDDHDNIPVALYPNPSSDRAYIVAESIKCVKVYNMQGRLIKAQEGFASDNIEIDLLDLPQSLYTIEVITDRGKARLKLSVTH